MSNEKLDLIFQYMNLRESFIINTDLFYFIKPFYLWFLWTFHMPLYFGYKNLAYAHILNFLSIFYTALVSSLCVFDWIWFHVNLCTIYCFHHCDQYLHLFLFILITFRCKNKEPNYFTGSIYKILRRKVYEFSQYYINIHV